MMPDDNWEQRKFAVMSRRLAKMLDEKYHDKPFFRDMSIKKAFLAHSLVLFICCIFLTSGFFLLNRLLIVGIALLLGSALLWIMDAFICAAYCVCQYCGESFIKDYWLHGSYCAFCGKKLGPRDSDSP